VHLNEHLGVMRLMYGGFDVSEEEEVQPNRMRKMKVERDRERERE